MTRFKNIITHKCKYLFALLSIFVIVNDAFATHNRAGEITYRHIAGYQYEATITTYTKTSGPAGAADRPELEIFWGDGENDTIPRANGSGVMIAPDIKMNKYIGTHIYSGASTYYIHFQDLNRNGGVQNIANSVNVPFYVESGLTILPISIPNSSPVLLQPPIDDGALNQIFIHNPNAWDPDGDSLSYELTTCKQDVNTTAAGFIYPSASISFSVDAITGDLIWNFPNTVGEYNMAMIIREWRTLPVIGLVNIGYVTRDLQVNIVPTSNITPVITSILDTCVEAGDTIAYTVIATDANGDQITLTATGGPFQVSQSPAQFTSTPANSVVTGNFIWNTTCAHVRRNPYAVVFKAQDNNPVVQLADIENMFITIVGPSPKNPTATPQANTINLTWNQSACSNAVGYKIYRHVGYFGFIPSQCETGVPAYTGYTLIHSQLGLSDTTYTDDNNGQGLATGLQYCYMIVATYPDGAESYASLEVCTSLKLDLPVITHADVLTTDNNNGKMYVAWSSPKELDTVQWQGPYRYTLQRATSTGTFSDVISFTNLNDTTYIDSTLNTADNQYRYKVQLFNETGSTNTLIGTTQTAYSIFLSISPGDNRLFLSWNVNVPWTDTLFVIYKQNTIGTFDSLTAVSSTSYIDSLVQNGTEYCYKIQSIGTYGIAGLISPIINNSEIECQTPNDVEPPCAPGSFIASVDCDLSNQHFEWANGAPDSCNNGDIQSYSIYFIPTASEDTFLIAMLMNQNSLSFDSVITQNLAGCYFITATDSNGNTSVASASYCMDGCPRYELPNVFTPNGDNVNNLFHPIEYKYRDVKDIDIKIYNRWGSIIFKTTNPRIDWNGKRNNTGEEVPEGVYHYICIVNELFLDGVKPRVLKGFIEVIRGDGGVLK